MVMKVDINCSSCIYRWDTDWTDDHEPGIRSFGGEIAPNSLKRTLFLPSVLVLLLVPGAVVVILLPLSDSMCDNSNCVCMVFIIFPISTRHNCKSSNFNISTLFLPSKSVPVPDPRPWPPMTISITSMV